MPLQLKKNFALRIIFFSKNIFYLKSLSLYSEGNKIVTNDWNVADRSRRNENQIGSATKRGQTSQRENTQVDQER